jgi:succinyl-CoA synthetase beta subunit
MDLYEYQARAVYPQYAIATTPGVVVASPEEALHAAAQFSPDPVVVKAQVKVGGRGKAGGVKLAKDPGEAAEAARAILALTIKGHPVRRVLVTQAVDIAAEYYLAVLLDRSRRSYLAMASAQGGMDIEALAAEHPGALAQVPIDPLQGLDDAAANDVVSRARFSPEVAGRIAETAQRVWEMVRGEDATLVEINPLVLTRDGQIVALDGKVTLDDNAAFRHPGRGDLDDAGPSDPLEARAQALGLGYVKLDGEVGVIGNGAGLVMSTLDVVAYAGERHGGVKPANFLDIGGGASAEVMANALGIVAADPSVKSILINVFGGITACDDVARGIVEAVNILGPAADVPIVVRLDGNAVAAGQAILAQADLAPVVMSDTMDDAADLAASLAHHGAGAAGKER